MKLLRYGPVGAERPALMDADGGVRDLSGVIRDVDGDALSDEALGRLRALDPASLPLVAAPGRLGPCVAGVGKFIAIGLNYSDHAAETGAEPPKEPIVFFKATSCICGPNDDVAIPRGAQKVDWEVELGFVIGKRAKYVEEADALQHVAGYCVVNDVSERDFQMQPRTASGSRARAPTPSARSSPWLVTPDEVPDPQTLSTSGSRSMAKRYAERLHQDDGLRHVAGTWICYVSRFMSLQPGDIITTGTPPGVGLGMKPERYLAAGQTMALGVEGLGTQRQRVVADA